MTTFPLSRWSSGSRRPPSTIRPRPSRSTSRSTLVPTACSPTRTSRPITSSSSCRGRVGSCVFDLSVPDPFDNCAETYFADYSNYNANVAGLVVDAQAIGLSDAQHTLSYQVTGCTGRYSGDVPGFFCDTAGGFDEGTGTYTAVLDATDPALDIDPLVCQGFWSERACDSGDPITVSTGSAGPGDNPTILALFPDNAPSRTPTLVET